jgi:hypothetical protein
MECKILFSRDIYDMQRNISSPQYYRKTYNMQSTIFSSNWHLQPLQV